MADGFMPRFVDLVRNTTTTVGTGNFVLGPAANGFTSFAEALTAGDRFYYSAIGVEKPSEREVGRGTLLADGTVVREPIGGSPTNFTAGTKMVALVAAAEWFEAVQSGSIGGPQSAALREDLAALADRSSPAMLLEAGREGIFAFDPADHSAEIAGDPKQGLYVSPESDVTGASGAWVRQFQGPMDVRWFGAKGDGANDDSAAIQAALNLANVNRQVRITGGIYKVTTLRIDPHDVTVIAHGATITSDRTSLTSTLSIVGKRARVFGGTWKLTAGSDLPWHFDVHNLECELDGCTMIKDPEAAHYQIYLREWSHGFVMRNCTARGSNGFFIESNNSSFLNNRLIAKAIGGDDCFAIKGLNTSVRNVRIEGNYIENFAAGLSIGSEIGTLGQADPAYSRRVGEVVFCGNTMKNCGGIAFIKPGAISNYEYCDGTVEDVVISNNTLIDESGAKFERGIALTPARGARIRGVYGRGNVIRARATSTVGRKIGAVDLHVLGYPGGTAEPSIRNVDLQVAFDDPHDGQSNSASRPGFAVTSFVSAEQEVAGIGTMSSIRLDIQGNGCDQAGISIGGAGELNDSITIANAVLTNTSRATASYGGFYADSRVTVEKAKIEPAAGQAYKLGPKGEISSRTDAVFFATQINAGDSGIQRPWAAPFRCYVTRIELLSDVAIPRSPDDTNFTQFEFRNISGTANVFHLVNSAASGGQAFPADVFNGLLQSGSIAAPASQADCYFARNGVLYVQKKDFGTGNTVRNARLRIHYAPY